jgi:hypothetical protein
MNWRYTKVSLGEYLIVCCWCSGGCLRDNNSNYRLEGSKGRKAADVWCGAWGVGGVHWEVQKWGRAWFEMGWGGGGRGESGFKVHGRQSSDRARYMFRVSSQCFSFRAKFSTCTKDFS